MADDDPESYGDPPTLYGTDDPTPTTLRKEGDLRQYILESTRKTDKAFADVLRGNPNLLNNRADDLDEDLLNTLERIYPDIQVTVRDDVNDSSGLNSFKGILKIEAPQKYGTAELRFYRDQEDMRREWSEGQRRKASIPIKGCTYTIEGDTEIKLVNQIGDTPVAFVLSFAGNNSSVARSELEMILTRLRITDEYDGASRALTEAIRNELVGSTGDDVIDLNEKVTQRMTFGLSQGAFKEKTRPDDIGFDGPIALRLKALAEKGVIGPWARPKNDAAFHQFMVARKGLRDTVGDPQPQPEGLPEGLPEDPFFEIDRIDILFTPNKRPSVRDWVSARMVILNNGTFQIFKVKGEDSPGALKNQLLRTGTMIGGMVAKVKNFRANSPRGVPPGIAKGELKNYQVSLKMEELDTTYAAWGKAVTEEEEEGDGDLDPKMKNKPSSKYILEFKSPEEAANFITQIQRVNEANTLSDAGSGVGMTPRRPRKATGA